jgi:hypothetical protein
MDPSNVQQQESVGILGVNLIYAAHHALASPEEFLRGIFRGWNRDEIHAFLVAGGYAEAVAFPADNQLTPPNELLYKRALVLAPGRFDSVTEVHANWIRDTLAPASKQRIEGEQRRTRAVLLICYEFPRQRSVGSRDFGTRNEASTAGLWRDAVSGSGTLYDGRAE